MYKRQGQKGVPASLRAGGTEAEQEGGFQQGPGRGEGEESLHIYEG